MPTPSFCIEKHHICILIIWSLKLLAEEEQVEERGGGLPVQEAIYTTPLEGRSPDLYI
jgi:hypothetical protein